jgi:hypothetical protein
MAFLAQKWLVDKPQEKPRKAALSQWRGNRMMMPNGEIPISSRLFIPKCGFLRLNENRKPHLNPFIFKASVRTAAFAAFLFIKSHSVSIYYSKE